MEDKKVKYFQDLYYKFKKGDTSAGSKMVNTFKKYMAKILYVDNPDDTIVSGYLLLTNAAKYYKDLGECQASFYFYYKKIIEKRLHQVYNYTPDYKKDIMDVGLKDLFLEKEIDDAFYCGGEVDDINRKSEKNSYIHNLIEIESIENDIDKSLDDGNMLREIDARFCELYKINGEFISLKLEGYTVVEMSEILEISQARVEWLITRMYRFLDLK